MKNMRSVRIVDIPAATACGYRWRWETVEGETLSPVAFDLFYDCLSDAKVHGYRVELRPAPASMRTVWSLESA